MNVKYIGLSEINGPLVALDHVSGISYDEMAEIKLDDGTRRLARVVEVEKDRAVLQVFEGTKGLSLVNTTTSFQGKPMELALSTEMLGRIFSGAGKPIDGLGEIFPEKYRDINGSPLNPVSRTYPRNYINTGISSIDALTTLIRGQKLPIFSGSGLSHNKLAVQIVRQAKIADENGQDFAIVFGAMGVKKRRRRLLQTLFRGNRRFAKGRNVFKPLKRPYHRAYPYPKMRPHLCRISCL